MIIIGVDFHPEFQQIAAVDTQTGELQERRLKHPEEAEGFYRELAKGRPGTSRDGSQRSRPLVRAADGRVADRALDRRCSRDPN